MSPAAHLAVVPPVVREERREPVLEFAVAKSLGYRARMGWVLALAGVGLALQLAFLSVFPGIPFLLAAVVLSWVVGFDNKLDRRGLGRDVAWESAPFEKVEEVVRLDGAMKSWDASAVDASSAWGCLLWIVVGVAIFIATGLAATVAGPAVAAIVGVDGGLLLLLQWFSGMRTLNRRPDLVLKARHLAETVGLARKRIDAAGTLRAQLRMAGPADSRAPEDARMVVLFGTDPGKLLLVQGQVVLNRAQGTPHPYFYAVVVAGRGEGFLAKARKATPPDNALIEAKTEGDVEIAVVRQATTKTSGYHTDARTSARLLTAALDLASSFAASRASAGAG